MVPTSFRGFFLPKGGTFSRLLTNVKTGGAKHYINCYADEMVGARRHHLAAVTWRGGGRWLRSKKSQRLFEIWSAPNFKKALTFFAAEPPPSPTPCDGCQVMPPCADHLVGVTIYIMFRPSRLDICQKTRKCSTFWQKKSPKACGNQKLFVPLHPLSAKKCRGAEEKSSLRSLHRQK